MSSDFCSCPLKKVGGLACPVHMLVAAASLAALQDVAAGSAASQEGGLNFRSLKTIHWRVVPNLSVAKNREPCNP